MDYENPPPVPPRSRTASFSALESPMRRARDNNYVDYPVPTSLTVPPVPPKDYALTKDKKSKLPNLEPVIRQDLNRLPPAPFKDIKIACERCRKCRCPQCQTPRKLKTARRLIDILTCMCCVRTCFYHCSDLENDEYDDTAWDSPCACVEKPHCLKRWAILFGLLPCLPCLICYPPLKGAVRVCDCMYDRASRKGACRCQQQEQHSDSECLFS